MRFDKAPATQFAYYECEECGYQIDAGLFGMMHAPACFCPNAECKTKFNLIKPGEQSIWFTKMKIKNPEGFEIKLPNGVIMEWKPVKNEVR